MKKGIAIPLIAILAAAVLALGVLYYTSNQDKTRQLEAAGANTADITAQIDALNAAVAEKSAQIEALSAEAAEKSAQIEALGADIAGKNEQIEKLTADVAEKTALIQTYFDDDLQPKPLNDSQIYIIRVNGETVTKKQVRASVNGVISQNEYLNQMYAMFGMQASYPTDAATITPQVISAYVEYLVKLQKARELGLDQLTDEETARIQTQTDESWQKYLGQVADYYFPNQKLEGEALEAEAMKYIERDGLNTRDDYLKNATEEVLLEKLQASAIRDVTVSDEEVKALYDEKVAADEKTYSASPASYGTAANGNSVVYYAPAGYRHVKHILIKLLDADSKAIDEKKTALTSAQSALTKAQSALTGAAEDADKAALQAAVDDAQKAVDEAQAAVDAATEAAFANIQAKTDEVYALAKAEGADFDALVKEYSQDSKSAPATYVLSKDSTNFVAPFTAGAMALENVGDVSEPVRTTYGYHIIKYVGDVAEGPVAYESVQEALTKEALTAKQEKTFDEAVAAWIAAATVKTYPEKMK